MTLALISFIHITAGLMFFGAVVGVLFYVLHAIAGGQLSAVINSLKLALMVDMLILPVIVIQFATAVFMVRAHHLSIQVPWIKVAYIAFGFVSLCWFVSLSLKLKACRVLQERHQLWPAFRKYFLVINAVMIVVFVVIVHDAVMQRTLLQFMF